MKFNEKLLAMRKKRGLSQEELGMELQVSRQTISKWEAGQSYPDFQRLVMLSDFFDMTLDELVKDIVFHNKTLEGAVKGVKWFIIGSCVFVCLIMVISLILYFLYPESNIFWHSY